MSVPEAELPDVLLAPSLWNIDQIEKMVDGRCKVIHLPPPTDTTLFENVNPEHSIFSEEIFGPVLSMMHPKNLGEAIQWINKLHYGNGATIFTSNGAYSRQFVQGVKCGMLGVNVGVPAAMALFPFSGWNDSFYGDLHMQGTEGVMFYTRQKVVLSRWDSTYQRQMGW
jgi:malonate-semialdehyde dehydrogenase (acetylating)/methylmalonate-semialdehyde dehydrogenase